MTGEDIPSISPFAPAREPHARVTHGEVWRLAGPIILSNLAVPLLGIVDTAVMGHLGHAYYIGAIALGSLIFNFLYWGFGFLRMGTTGLTAQAYGAGDPTEVRSALARALIVGAVIAFGLIALQWPASLAAFSLLQGSENVESLARDYFDIRIWGAPAALANFGILGWFIGCQEPRYVLILQIWMNGINIVLDVLFVVGFGWDVRGVALGTLIAEYAAVALGFLLITHRIRGDGGAWVWSSIVDAVGLAKTVAVNRDIFLRTLCLIFGFAWFTAQSAKEGDVILAANTVLLQFLTFAAFGLDAFAYAVEALVGKAFGARDERVLSSAVRMTTLWAFLVSLGVAAIYFIAGPSIVNAITDVPAVRAAAYHFLPWAAAMPLLSVWAFQLDGIFIGATRTADMRNMMLVSLAVYLVSWWLLAPSYGNHGLWFSFMVFYVIRGVTLAARYPALVRATPRAAKAGAL